MTNGLLLSYYPYAHFSLVSLFLRLVYAGGHGHDHIWKTFTSIVFLSMVLQLLSTLPPTLISHVVCVKHRGFKLVPSSFKILCLCTALIRMSGLGSFIPGKGYSWMSACSECVYCDRTVIKKKEMLSLAQKAYSSGLEPFQGQFHRALSNLGGTLPTCT